MAINTPSQPSQIIDDPTSLLFPPGGWEEIYSASYFNVFDEPAGTMATVDAIEFPGIEAVGLGILSPDQVVALAPGADRVAIDALGPLGANVYGSKVFHTISSFSLPILGTITVDHYRYVVAHGAV